MIEAYATSVRENRETLSTIAKAISPKFANMVKERLEAQGYAVTPAAENRRRAMRHKNALDKLRKEQAKEWVEAGHEFYRPSQATYTAVVREHLDGCESDEYPTATKIAQAVVGDNATKLLAKPAKKNLRKAFDENKEHPGMKRIYLVADNSTMVAAASGTVSSCLSALTNSHKVARLMNEQQRRTQALEARLAIAEAEAARANIRLDLKDAGKDWKEKARVVLAVKPSISNRALGSECGVHESTIRKYRDSL